jgi:hypothetical protein
LLIQKHFDLVIGNPFDFNLEQIYSSNKGTFEMKSLENGISKELATQFLNENIDFESLLYFENGVDRIIETLKEWSKQINGKSNSSTTGLPQKRITLGDSAFFYSDFSDLYKQLESANSFHTTLSTIQIKKAITNIKDQNKRKTPSPKNSYKPKPPTEDLGFMGEWLVYKHLLSYIKNKENVKWVSAYAKLAGVNSDGINGLGYDIVYIPNEAKYPRYVEVKVVGWENAIHISSNEILKGEQLKNHYEIFLVRNFFNPSNISIEIIQGPFDYKRQRSFTDNELFRVINDTFILEFEKVAE